MSHEEILNARVLDTESSFDRAQSVDDGKKTNYMNDNGQDPMLF